MNYILQFTTTLFVSHDYRKQITYLLWFFAIVSRSTFCFRSSSLYSNPRFFASSSVCCKLTDIIDSTRSNRNKQDIVVSRIVKTKVDCITLCNTLCSSERRLLAQFEHVALIPPLITPPE